MVSVDPIADIFVNAEKKTAQVALGVAMESVKSGKMKPEQAAEVAQEFESVFLAQMLQALNPPESREENELFGNKESNEIFYGMMMDEYAKSMAASGGIGIARYVERELLGQRGVSSRPVSYDIPIGAYQQAAERIDNEQQQAVQQGGAL